MSVAQAARDLDAHTSAITGARIAHAKVLAMKTGVAWQTIFQDRWPRSLHLDRIKATVPAMGTDTTPALLVTETFVTAWANSLRAATVLGKLTGASPAPFYTKLITSTGAATGYWVGEGKAKPLTRSAYFGQSVLPPRKVAAPVVLTEELLMSPFPDAEALVQKELAGALIEVIDETFVDPANAGSADRPASITNGCFSVPSSGTDPAAIDADVAKAWGSLIAANIPLHAPALITSAAVALHLTTLRDPTGARAYPLMGLTGGQALGADVIVSASVGPQIIVIDQSFLLVARAALDIRSSRQSTIEMVDNPVGDALAPTGPAKVVSLWQENLLGVLLEQAINWQMARVEAVARVADIVLPNAAKTRKAA